ncbi:unnamed protein product [Allacma fusca]|uniref:Ig-like domain-containing protein n=1 Tax=Allacma fusca TaxID=39272 RepID=A0A8J2PEP0_9HEXA|nr:unnamed protein product [Allacma fusca]
MRNKSSLFCAFLAQFALVIGLKLKNVSIPQYGWMDAGSMLSCDFDLEEEKLLVLKWYKDGHEFYRYTPTSKQPILTFPIDGVYVDVSKSTLNNLLLKNVTLKTGGTYKCEVSADRPTFKTLSQQSELIVIAPPKSAPEITGIHEVVSVGDSLRGNCTSWRSKPAASLMFYVNGVKAENGDTVEYSPQSDAEGLETSVLGVKFQVEPSHFRNGVMELRCTATIGNGYWVKIKTISDASINAQPSIPGHNRLSTSGVESVQLGQKRGSFTGLIVYGFTFSGLLLLLQQQQQQVLFPHPLIMHLPH